MIGYLKGPVLQKFDSIVLLDINGIGYEVHVGPSSFSEASVGSDHALYIHHHIREDQETLYGFSSLDERQLFRKLISVSGIGPKSGLAAMSAAPLHELVNAIHLEDHGVFQAVSGIGPKTAKRLVLELKPKIHLIATGIALNDAETKPVNSIRGDVIAALEALGYQAQEIREAIGDMELAEMPLDEAIRKALDAMRK